MRVQVHYFGQIKRAAGCSTETVHLSEGSAVADLVRSLVGRHGRSLREMLLTERGDLRAEAGVQVNGRNVVRQQGLDTPLREEDRAVIVLLAPPVMGG